MHPRNFINVTSSGRCGSNNVVEHFISANYTLITTYTDDSRHILKKIKLNKKNKIVVHNHQPEFNFEGKKAEKLCFNILVARKDRFAQITSALLSTKLQEIPTVMEYVKKHKDSITHPKRNYSELIPEIIVDKKLFIKKADEITSLEKKRFEVITNSPIPYDILYYEDFIKDLESLKKYTPHVKRYKKLVEIKKNPLQAKNLIINHQEMLDWWEEYQTRLKDN